MCTYVFETCLCKSVLYVCTYVLVQGDKGDSGIPGRQGKQGIQVNTYCRLCTEYAYTHIRMYVCKHACLHEMSIRMHTVEPVN